MFIKKSVKSYLYSMVLIAGLLSATSAFAKHDKDDKDDKEKREKKEHKYCAIVIKSHNQNGSPERNCVDVHAAKSRGLEIVKIRLSSRDGKEVYCQRKSECEKPAEKEFIAVSDASKIDSAVVAEPVIGTVDAEVQVVRPSSGDLTASRIQAALKQ